jgi:glycosidase
VFHWYRRLIALRKASPALRQGGYRPLIRRPVHALAYLRETSDQTVLVALNFSSRPTLAAFDERLPARDWHVLLSTARRPELEMLGHSLALAPYEACVLGMA